MPEHATTEAAPDGTAVSHPIDGTAVSHPIDGTAVSHPIDGTAVDDPAVHPIGVPVVDLDALRGEIDYLDAEILRLVQRRTAVSKAIGSARMAAGGPRVVHGREMAVLDRYRDLGVEGRELAMLLLRLGRGRLGRC